MWADYQIKKAANPMKLKAKTATVKRSKVKVKVKAAGNSSYKASAWKNVTFTVKVK